MADVPHNPEAGPEMQNPLAQENAALREQNEQLVAELARMRGEVRTELASIAGELHSVASRLEALAARLGENAVQAPIETRRTIVDIPADEDDTRVVVAPVASAPPRPSVAPRAPRPPAPPADNHGNRNRDGWLRRNGRRIAAVGAVALALAGAYALGKDDGRNDKVDARVTRDAPPADSASEKAAKARIAMLKRAEDAKTVPGAVKRMHSTDATIHKNISAIFNEEGVNKLDHRNNAMSSMLSRFDVGKLGPINGAEAVAYSIKGSDAFAAKQYEALNGKGSSASPEQIRAYFERELSKDGTQFSITTPKGTFMNHGQSTERGVFPAGIVNLNGDKEVLTITLENGKTLYFKIFNNNCVNTLTPISIKVTPKVVTKAPPPTSPTPELKSPPIVGTPDTPKGPKAPEEPKKDTDKPKKEIVVDKPKDKEIPKEEKVVPTKTDDGNPGAGNSPAPTDGDRGVRTGVEETTEPVAGHSPANVVRPPAPVIPAPQIPSSEAQGRPPAETGTQPNNEPQTQVPGTSNGQSQGGNVDPNAV